MHVGCIFIVTSSYPDGVRRELVLVPRHDLLPIVNNTVRVYTVGVVECVTAFALFGVCVFVVLAPDTGR